jgi:hypothetical protein|tara:strand:+ start:32 stop:271 length:240 start_codon:yes stop_codon:yes gene_type:complete
MDKSFISVLVAPLPVEKKLATELKIRDIIACNDIELLKNYTIKLVKQNVNHDYVLTHALVKILEMEDEMNKKKRFGLFN